MRDYLSIGSTPCDEPCAQVGSDGYHDQTRRESAAYIAQLRRMFGPEPEGASLRVKSFPHDYGSYHEVVCYFDDQLPASMEYAFKCEREGPANWDAIAEAHLLPKFLTR